MSRRTFLMIAVALALAVPLLVPVVLRYFSSSSSIEVVAAEYGVPGRTCTAGAEVKQHVSLACGGFRPRCLVSVSDGWCGDPAPDAIKTLTVDYRCGDVAKRASAAEGSGIELSCP